MAEPKRRGRPKKVQEEVIQEVEMEEINEDVQETGQEEVFEASNNQAKTNQEFIGDLGTGGNYNPFSEDVIEREYATPKTAEGLTDDIPEPSFESNVSFEDLMNDSEADAEDEKSPFDNPNPALDDLPPQEKQIACEQMVDTFLDVYATLKGLSVSYCKFSDESLNELIINDEIDPDTIIPTENGELTISEFVNSYNKQVEEALSYDKEFGHSIRPALVREFMKRGWAMTDLQRITFAFGVDIAKTTASMFTFKKTMKTTMDFLREIYAENKRRNKNSRPRRQYKGEQYQEEVYEEEEYDEEAMVIENEQDLFVANKKTDVVPEFKRPKKENHPKMVQEEMDRANKEAKNDN